MRVRVAHYFSPPATAIVVDLCAPGKTYIHNFLFVFGVYHNLYFICHIYIFWFATEHIINKQKLLVMFNIVVYSFDNNRQAPFSFFLKNQSSNAIRTMTCSLYYGTEICPDPNLFVICLFLFRSHRLPMFTFVCQFD